MSSIADIKARAEQVKHLRTILYGQDGATGEISVSDAEKALAQLIIDLADALENLAGGAIDAVASHEHKTYADHSHRVFYGGSYTGPPLEQP